MKMTKRIVAVLICIVLALTAVSCGENSNWIAKKDGENVPAGIYIYYLISARGEAEGKLEEGQELFETKIEDKDAATWISDRALQLTKEYLIVEQLFEENKLTLPEGEEEYINYYAQYLWSYYGEVYTKNGISINSMISVMLNDSKSTEVFKNLYGKDGEREIPQADIDNYLLENVARLKVITFDITDENGEEISEEELKKVNETANGYFERLKNGEDIVALADEYDESLKEETSSDTTSSEATSSEVTSSEATSSELTSSETTSSETTSSDEEEKVDTRHQSILLKNNTSLKTENTEKIFALKEGEYTMVTDKSQIIIAQRFNILEDKDASEAYASTARQDLKGDEYKEYITSLTTQMQLEVNNEAVKRYSPKNLKL